MGRVDFSFYLITDRHQTAGRPLIDVCQAAMRAGVRGVQLREKDLPTRALLSLTREVATLAAAYDTRLLINDRMDLVLTTGIAGVHLPADGCPPSVARAMLGAQALIGVSAHSAREAASAERAGADFVVLGPIFDTPSKRHFGEPIGLSEVERARALCRIPIFGIGGINAARVREVRRAGANGIAVISSVMAAEDVERACREILSALDGAILQK